MTAERAYAKLLDEIELQRVLDIQQLGPQRAETRYLMRLGGARHLYQLCQCETTNP